MIDKRIEPDEVPVDCKTILLPSIVIVGISVLVGVCTVKEVAALRAST